MAVRSSGLPIRAGLESPRRELPPWLQGVLTRPHVCSPPRAGLLLTFALPNLVAHQLPRCYSFCPWRAGFCRHGRGDANHIHPLSFLIDPEFLIIISHSGLVHIVGSKMSSTLGFLDPGAKQSPCTEQHVLKTISNVLIRTIC